jgi:hypothetical protein
MKLTQRTWKNLIHINAKHVGVNSYISKLLVHMYKWAINVRRLPNEQHIMMKSRSTVVGPGRVKVQSTGVVRRSWVG